MVRSSLGNVTLEVQLRACVRAGRRAEADACAEALVALAADDAARALRRLWLGVLMEDVGDFAAAARHYAAGAALRPADPVVHYFCLNNGGFSLNQLGRFAAAEPCLRAALAVDATRPNAYKNLGLCLSGQGRLAEAAACFLDGTVIAPSDRRALWHLQALVAQHPEVPAQVEDFAQRYARARVAVTAVAVGGAIP
jgi:tetratricopeptide (TPR) repeat protein